MPFDLPRLMCTQLIYSSDLEIDPVYTRPRYKIHQNQSFDLLFKYTNRSSIDQIQPNEKFCSFNSHWRYKTTSKESDAEPRKNGCWCCFSPRQEHDSWDGVDQAMEEDLSTKNTHINQFQIWERGNRAWRFLHLQRELPLLVSGTGLRAERSEVRQAHWKEAPSCRYSERVWTGRVRRAGALPPLQP